MFAGLKIYIWMLTAPNCVAGSQIRKLKITFRHFNFNYFLKNIHSLWYNGNTARKIHPKPGWH